MSEFDPADSAHAHDDGSASPADARGRGADNHWPELLRQVGHEVALPLSAAAQRLEALAATGRIDRQNLRALQQEVELARRAGMVGQQLARFAAGHVRQASERLPLGRLLRDLVQQRRTALQARGLTLRPSLKDLEVTADAALLFGLCSALLDWCAECAQSTIDLRVSLKAWPVQAQLSCRFAWRTTETTAPPADAAVLNSLNWRLVQHMAWAMGLLVDREDIGVETIALLQFPRLLSNEQDPEDQADTGPDSGPSSLSSRPLAGSQVLVVLADEALRAQVREAVAHMGLLLDVVDDVEAARQYCAEGLPHALIYGARDIDGPPQEMDALRQALREQVPELPFIELVPEGDGIELSHVAGAPVSRVGLKGLQGGLASALIFELSRSL